MMKKCKHIIKNAFSFFVPISGELARSRARARDCVRVASGPEREWRDGRVSDERLTRGRKAFCSFLAFSQTKCIQCKH
jgi:hypothetical protein